MEHRFFLSFLLFTKGSAPFFFFLARDASSPGVVAALDPADADDLGHLAPEADGRAVEGLFVGVDAGALPDQVGLERADESGALNEFPSAESDDRCWKDRLALVDVLMEMVMRTYQGSALCSR